jgi:hypothetical protein
MAVHVRQPDGGFPRDVSEAPPVPGLFGARGRDAGDTAHLARRNGQPEGLIQQLVRARIPAA